MLKIFKKIYPYITALLIVYLLGNIVVSQNISQSYFKLSDFSLPKSNLHNEAFNFLISIRKLPEFETFLPRFKAVFGNSIEDDIKKEDGKRSIYFKNLEYIIEKNPKSRDALLKLYLYYIQENQPDKAIYYLNKAKEIDPSLNKL